MLAAGLPGIGTDQTGSALELIADNKAGWLVPAGDAAALENAMEQALRLDDAAFASMQKAARNAASTYGLDVAAPRFLELCREALSNWHCIKTEISA